LTSNDSRRRIAYGSSVTVVDFLQVAGAIAVCGLGLVPAIPNWGSYISIGLGLTYMIGLILTASVGTFRKGTCKEGYSRGCVEVKGYHG
jgi:hypothetical protein